jgi:hypothetical protein
LSGSSGLSLEGFWVTVKVPSLKRRAAQQRERDLNNLFRQVVSPYGHLHLFGARPVHLAERYEQELVGRQVPQMWRRGKLASKTD